MVWYLLVQPPFSQGISYLEVFSLYIHSHNATLIDVQFSMLSLRFCNICEENPKMVFQNV